MEVRIGVVHSPRELSLDTQVTADEIVQLAQEALDAKQAVLWLTDSKGKKIGVPTDKIAFIEIVGDGAERKVGFAKG